MRGHTRLREGECLHRLPLLLPGVATERSFASPVSMWSAQGRPSGTGTQFFPGVATAPTNILEGKQVSRTHPSPGTTPIS